MKPKLLINSVNVVKQTINWVKEFKYLIQNLRIRTCLSFYVTHGRTELCYIMLKKRISSQKLNISFISEYYVHN